MLICLIDAVEHPLVGHVGVIEVRDRAVGHRSEDVVALMSCADGPELGVVLLAVARGTEQCGESAARARAVRDDPVGIAGRQAMAVVAQVAHGRLVIDEKGRSLADVRLAVIADRRAAADSRRCDDIALRERDERGIGAAAHAFTGARLLAVARHVAADAVRQEDRRGLRRVAIDCAALLEIRLGDEDAHGLGGDGGRLCCIDDIAVGAECHILSLELQRLLRVVLRIELQAVLRLLYLDWRICLDGLGRGGRRAAHCLRSRLSCRLRRSIGSGSLRHARCPRHGQGTDSQSRQDVLLQVHGYPHPFMIIMTKRKPLFFAEQRSLILVFQRNDFARAVAFSFSWTPRERIILGDDSTDDGTEDGGRRDFTCRVALRGLLCAAVLALPALMCFVALLLDLVVMARMPIRVLVVMRGCFCGDSQRRAQHAKAHDAGQCSGYTFFPIQLQHDDLLFSFGVVILLMRIV